MIDTPTIYGAVHDLLLAIGEDPQREGLKETPERVVRAYQHLFSGYDEDPNKVLAIAFTDDFFDGMIIESHIDFVSTCEHHMLPFFGQVHIGYIPKDNRLTGASKLARVVEVFARRLQIQERMTRQIAQAIQDVLDPIGVGVIVEAQHMCMTARGVEKENVMYGTDSMFGAFHEQSVKMEFLSRIK